MGRKMAERQSMKNIHETPIILLFCGPQPPMGIPNEVFDRARCRQLCSWMVRGRPLIQRLGLLSDPREHFSGFRAPLKFGVDQMPDARPSGESIVVGVGSLRFAVGFSTSRLAHLR